MARGCHGKGTGVLLHSLCMIELLAGVILGQGGQRAAPVWAGAHGRCHTWAGRCASRRGSGTGRGDRLSAWLFLAVGGRCSTWSFQVG